MEVKDIIDNWVINNFDINKERKLVEKNIKKYNQKLNNLLFVNEIEYTKFLIELDKIIIDVEIEIEKEYNLTISSTNIRVEYDYDHEDFFTYLICKYFELETDKEVISRIKHEKKAEINREK